MQHRQNRNEKNARLTNDVSPIVYGKFLGEFILVEDHWLFHKRIRICAIHQNKFYCQASYLSSRHAQNIFLH